jgi:Rrf2 family cysteine metabolism transcriptional repressor
MKLSTRSEYSILALIYLARNKDQGYVKLKDICKSYRISKKYLELLLSVLKQNKYLKAKRGAGGGYMLAKPADKITLAEIIRLMDGALAATESVSKYFYSETPLLQESCVIKIFKEIRDLISNKLEGIYLSDLI